MRFRVVLPPMLLPVFVAHGAVVTEFGDEFLVSGAPVYVADFADYACGFGWDYFLPPIVEPLEPAS